MPDHLRVHGVTDAAVLRALAEIHEHGPFWRDDRFGARGCDDPADGTVPPRIIGCLAQTLRLTAVDRVLETGTGTGFGAAVLSRLGASVMSVSFSRESARRARHNLALLGCNNVRVVSVSEADAPWRRGSFDAISIASLGPLHVADLFARLAVGGRLASWVGQCGEQGVVRILRSGPETFVREELG